MDEMKKPQDEWYDDVHEILYDIETRTATLKHTHIYRKLSNINDIRFLDNKQQCWFLGLPHGYTIQFAKDVTVRIIGGSVFVGNNPA